MKARLPFQFRLLTLLLIVTLFAVACSIWKTSPPLGCVITAMACAGLMGLILRSLVAARRGERLSGEEKMLAFANAIWIVGVAVMFLGLAIVGYCVLYFVWWF
jgi:hypothetical protein